VTFCVDFFCKNDRSSTNNWASFINGKSYALITTKNGLGYILGDLFTNASGHPDPTHMLLEKVTRGGICSVVEQSENCLLAWDTHKICVVYANARGSVRARW
jgi:hypothetical protein